jgi:hypothetical protein
MGARYLPNLGGCNVRSGSKVGTYGRNFPNQQEGIEKSHTRVLQ